ncbi:MAG TPA: hypothetical protein DD000_02470, partial [Cyanobacteria bacterium UBA11166]|nr:hypothetical protein [Cyanobacteria bacterium UBA11166]
SVPTTGFITTLLLNQNLCVRNDISTGTARAFIYPLFLAFLYYLLRGSLLPCLLTIVLEGLFYPPLLFISLGILTLRLLYWEKILPRFSQNRSDYVFFVTGLGVALLVMLPYALASSEFGPVITATEARTLPEFLPGGRTYFFSTDPLQFWLFASRSGLFACDFDRYLRLPKILPLNLAGLLLPILLVYSSHFPLARQVTSRVKILLQIILASLIMFFAAHVLLFKLYGPSRYATHSLRFAIAVAAGI